MFKLVFRQAALAALGFTLFAGTAQAYPYGYDNYGWHRKHPEAVVLYEDRRPERVVVVPAAPPPPREEVIVQRPVYPYFANRQYVEVRCNNNASILGGVVGGVSGGLLAEQFAHGHNRNATILGSTLLGALLGEQVETPNENCTQQALEYARPNTQVVWRDRVGYQYSVLPGTIYLNKRGLQCRHYDVNYDRHGQLRHVAGRACRQPDGNWVFTQKR